MILTEIAGVEPEVTGRGELTVPVAGEEALPVAVSRLAAAGIAFSELSLHLPSLDEVFLTLTGRPGEEAEEGGSMTTDPDPDRTGPADDPGAARHRGAQRPGAIRHAWCWPGAA